MTPPEDTAPCDGGALSRPTGLAERLSRHTKVDALTGCHNWILGVQPNGYARIALGGRGSKKVAAHRLAYELARGPIPDGLELDHLCRNRRCCNPDHLEPVTTRENQLRGEGVSGRHARQTHCSRGHEFTPENTYSDRPGWRHCRTCRREDDRRRRERAK